MFLKSSHHYINFDTWQSESYLTPFRGFNYERLCMLRRGSWTICFVKLVQNTTAVFKELNLD